LRVIAAKEFQSIENPGDERIRIFGHYGIKELPGKNLGLMTASATVWGAKGKRLYRKTLDRFAIS
jgi:hypothetical protein